MGKTSRRGFLKGVGVTLSTIGLSGPPTPTIPSQHDRRGRAGRSMITQAALEILVVEQLRARCAQSRQFTAYDVTRALRKARPGVNIVHARVRETVHRFMAPAVASSVYTCALIDFPTGWAWLYCASPV